MQILRLFTKDWGTAELLGINEAEMAGEKAETSERATRSNLSSHQSFDSSAACSHVNPEL